MTLRLKTSSTPVQTGIDALVGDVTVVSLVWCRVFVAMVTGGVGHGGARPEPNFSGEAPRGGASSGPRAKNPISDHTASLMGRGHGPNLLAGAAVGVRDSFFCTCRAQQKPRDYAG